ncbi:MAG: reverse transcriptase-like protein [Actinobacteria bacterium]|nr:reverse transcriptase-like protein [Actinomycetota bacterium]
MSATDFVVHFDGACSLKREVGAGAAVLYDSEGTELAYRAAYVSRATHGLVTTPICEYLALHVGLVLAAHYSPWCPSETTNVVAMGDAELIVRQVDGRYACRKPYLLKELNDVKVLMRLFKSCRVVEFPKAGPQHKRRWGNARADEIAGLCVKAGHDLYHVDTPVASAKP